MSLIVPTLFDYFLNDIGAHGKSLSEEEAEQCFAFFKEQPLFKWKNTNNGCEGRADAVCLLLDEWDIPNFKAWVFSGDYLKKHIGALKQNWKYHVAPVLPVKKNGALEYFVLDPSTGSSLQLIEQWAANITLLPHSYYFIKQPQWYIFPHKNIGTAKWNTRNKQNRKWMIQCLAGINSLTATGKARLCFNKTRIKETFTAFQKMKRLNPLQLKQEKRK